MNSKRWLSLILAVCLAAVLVLSGCAKKEASNSGTESAANSDKPQQTTIKVAWFSPSPEVFVDPFLNAFMDKHPHIKIEPVISPNYQAYTEKMAIAIAGGEIYDAVFINTEFAQWAGQDYLADLSSLIQDSGLDMSKTYKDYDQPLKWDDKQYALPYYVTAYATYYNKEMFDAANLPYPQDNFTWEEYTALAKQLTKGDGPDKVYGSLGFDWVMTLLPMVNQQGRDMFTATEQDIVEALKYKHHLTNELKVQPTVAENLVTKSNPNALFRQGKGAMMYSVPATFNQTTEAIKQGEAQFTLGMTTMPQLPGTTQPKTIGNITSWGIPAESKNKEAAWEFIRFMTGPETADLKLKSGNTPANDLGSADQLYDRFKQFFESDGKVLPEGAKVFFTQEVTLELPFHPLTAQLRNIYESEAELALTGGKSIEDAAAEIVKQRDELLKK